jgi:hypothetical protein
MGGKSSTCGRMRCQVTALQAAIRFVTSPFGPCDACNSTGCVCTCGQPESSHRGLDHDFDPTDCRECTNREIGHREIGQTD